MAIAGHALRAAVTAGGVTLSFFGEACTDGRLVLFEHLPDGFEVVFLQTLVLSRRKIISRSLPLRDCYC